MWLGRHSHLVVGVVLLLVLSTHMGVSSSNAEPLPSATFVEANDDSAATATPALVAVTERTVVENGGVP